MLGSRPAHVCKPPPPPLGGGAYLDLAFLDHGVQMEDALVPAGDDVLALQDEQLGSEHLGDADEAAGLGQHVTDMNVIIVDILRQGRAVLCRMPGWEGCMRHGALVQTPPPSNTAHVRANSK